MFKSTSVIMEMIHEFGQGDRQGKQQQVSSSGQEEREREGERERENRGRLNLE